MRASVFAVTVTHLFATVLFAAAQESTEKVLLDDRVWIATQIYATVSANFAHWSAVPHLDFDQEFRSYLNKITATDDRRSFDMATFELIAKLKNGHTRYSDKWLTDNYGAELGFAVQPMENSWVVTQSRIAELHVGDRVTKLDGQNFEEFFHNASKYIAASSERAARFALVYCPYLFPDSFTLELADGRTVHVKRQHYSPQEKAGLKVKQEQQALYLRIPSFTDRSLEASAIEEIKKHSDAHSLILDVRGNGGGSTPQSLLGTLMAKPYHIWRESTPDSIGIFRAWGAEHGELVWTQTFQPSGDRYRGQIYILVDGGCASACEDFVAPFKETHRATIIGEPTWGSTGQPIYSDFGSGMSLSVSTKREFFPDGSQFEGVGVVPDVDVHLSSQDLRIGRDPVLEKADAMIRDGEHK